MKLLLIVETNDPSEGWTVDARSDSAFEESSHFDKLTALHSVIDGMSSYIKQKHEVVQDYDHIK